MDQGPQSIQVVPLHIAAVPSLDIHVVNVLLKLLDMEVVLPFILMVDVLT